MDNNPNNNQEVFEAGDILEPTFEQELTRPKNPWIQRFIGVAIICSFFVIQFIAGIIMVYFMVVHGNLGATSIETASGALSDMFLGMVISESIAIFILILIFNKKIWIKVKQAVSPIVVFVLKIAGYFALLWFVTIAFSVLDSILFPNLIEEAGSNQELIEAALSTPSLAMIISICLTAPIVEEFVFRYGVISKLLYGVNKYVAAVIAALIFAFAHIGFDQMSSAPLFIHLMIGYLGQALVFGFVYVREDNLLYPIVIHILNNLQAVILILALAKYA